jgi:hypothetical protein
MIELLACPCCGGAASIDGYKEHYSAGCEDCGLQTIYRESEAETAKAWNNRSPSLPAPDPRYDARCAQPDWEE